MKTKKLLFGMIEMKAVLYNILYTLICVVVLATITLFQLYAVSFFYTQTNSDVVLYGTIFIVLVQTLFIGHKILSKNNYT